MEWICRTCTLRNPETTIKCAACDNARNPRDACEPVVPTPTEFRHTTSHHDVSTRAPRDFSSKAVLRLTPLGDHSAACAAATQREEHADAKTLDTLHQSIDACGVSSTPAASSQARAPAATINPNRAGMNATRVGIDRAEQCRVEEEIRAKRRRQNEEKERILREIEADQACRARPSAPAGGRPMPTPPVPRTSPSATPSTVRIQLKAGSRCLVCSAFSPDATLRQVLTFANNEMAMAGRIMRPEIMPNADPEFMRRTQEMLQQATAVQDEAAGRRPNFVALHLPYPPRTRWADTDLDITLLDAGLTPSCTMHLESEAQDGQAHGHQASAAPGEEFQHRPRYGEVDSDEESIESSEVTDYSEVPRMPLFSSEGTPDDPQEQISRAAPMEPVSAADRARILEAAQRRNAQATCSTAAPQQGPISCTPISGPGSKTRKEKEEEKRRILQRADEERQEREMFQAARRAACQDARQPAPGNNEQNDSATPKQKEMMVQIRHADGTEAVKVTEEMTFETLLADLRTTLRLGEEAFTFRTRYPPRKFSADEQSLRVATTVSMSAVIFLEKEVTDTQNSSARAASIPAEAPAVVVQEDTDTESALTAESQPTAEPSQRRGPSAREAALAAAERRRLCQVAPHEATVSPSTPTPTTAPTPSPIPTPAQAPTPAPIPTPAPEPTPAPTEATASALGLSREARLQQLRQLELERKAKEQEKERILKEAKADQAFRAAKRMVPVSGLGECPDARHAPSAPSEPVERLPPCGARPPLLRVRDPRGTVHSVDSTEEMSLADALTRLNITPDTEALIALVLFPRRQLTAEDWLTPLRRHSDLFPHGTIILCDASLRGQQQRSEEVVWNPFGVDAMHDALPPPIRDGAELQDRLARVVDGTVTEQLVRNEGRCIICVHDFQLNERLGTLQCTHQFHRDCIEILLRYSQACPVCRRDV